VDFERLTNMVNIPRERLQELGRVGMRALGVIAVAYVAASALNAYFMSGMLGKALTALNKKPSRPVVAASLNLTAGGENYRDLVKAIKDRNIFNSSGEFPEEKSVEDNNGGKKEASTFNINGPCKKPQADVELVGTIYMGDDASIATLQEKGYSETDTYKVGDVLIGSDSAQIVKIERNRVIINNAGVKECLELAGDKLAKGSGSGSGEFPNASPTKPPAGGQISGAAEPAAAGNDCVLEEKYVQDELGPGFGTIIQKARLVPNTTDNVMNGFKIFAIDSNSLLAKTGLKNGDIITQVNETSLKQPEQGFALYQAFQDEREVRIHILRGGTTPMMITCRIK
jgi:general secretion pathway protein C